MQSADSEPLKITIWREYKDRLRAGEGAPIIIKNIANRLDKKIGCVSNLIWQVELESGEFYCRINGIDNLQWGEIEQ